MNQLLTWLANLITKLLEDYTKTLSTDQAPSLSVSQTSSTLNKEVSELLISEGEYLSLVFKERFSSWSLDDKELVKKLVMLNSIKISELNAEEMLEFSELLDQASQLSAEKSIELNKFKKEFLDSADLILSKAIDIGSKIAVGALIALI